MSFRMSGFWLQKTAYENLSDGIISVLLRYSVMSFAVPSDVICPSHIVPPNSWISNFSSSFVSMIRRFSSSMISLWGRFRAFRNSRISALDSFGFRPRMNMVFIELFGFCVYKIMFEYTNAFIGVWFVGLMAGDYEKLCCMFPGQGSSIERIRESYLKYEGVRKVLEDAREVVGDGLVDFAIKGEGEVSGGVDSQLYTVLTGCVYSVALREKRVRCDVAVGHSLGTYAALYAAGIVKDVRDVLEITRKRAGFLERCVKDQFGDRRDGDNYMAAIVGCDLEKVEYYCDDVFSGRIYVANVNSGSQVVVSGEPIAIERAVKKFSKLYGGKVRLLREIGGPYHCSLMDDASGWMRDYLGGVDCIGESDEAVWISDHTGKVVKDVEGVGGIKDVLARQINGRVNWVDAIGTAIGLKCGGFAECGPGRTLTRFLRGLGVTIHMPKN